MQGLISLDFVLKIYGSEEVIAEIWVLMWSNFRAVPDKDGDLGRSCSRFPRQTMITVTTLIL